MEKDFNADKEWIELIQEAKNIGLTIEDERKFIRGDRSETIFIHEQSKKKRA